MEHPYRVKQFSRAVYLFENLPDTFKIVIEEEDGGKDHDQ
jgi:hypothetical protein